MFTLPILNYLKSVHLSKFYAKTQTGNSGILLKLEWKNRPMTKYFQTELKLAIVG